MTAMVYFTIGVALVLILGIEILRWALRPEAK